MKLTMILDNELSLQRQMPEKLPIHGIDAPEIFMSQEGMALKKPCKKRGLPSL